MNGSGIRSPLELASNAGRSHLVGAFELAPNAGRSHLVGAFELASDVLCPADKSLTVLFWPYFRCFAEVEVNGNLPSAICAETRISPRR